MRKLHKARAALATLCILAAVEPVGAVTLRTNSSGQLTGAEGVDVGGTLYDVTFAEGTCASVYGACETSNFDFKSASDALNAARALVSQVYVGQYDTDVRHIFGCGGATAFCDTYVPFENHVTVQFGSTFNFAVTHNWNAVSDAPPDDFPYYEDWAAVYPVIAGGVGVSFDSNAYPENDGANWARFTPSMVPGVPESATWTMMILGFCTVGVALRRQKPCQTKNLGRVNRV